MSKKKQSLFTCEESRKLWDMSDDGVLEEVTFGSLYPGTFIPYHLSSIKVEVLTLHKFPEKYKEEMLEWLSKNADELD